MVLKGKSIIAYGLQMCSISPVDSAVGGLDHVRMTTIQDLSHGSSHPWQGASPLFVWEELYLLLKLVDP